MNEKIPLQTNHPREDGSLGVNNALGISSRAAGVDYQCHVFFWIHLNGLRKCLNLKKKLLPLKIEDRGIFKKNSLAFELTRAVILQKIFKADRSGHFFANTEVLDGMVHALAGFFDAFNGFFVHNHEFGTDLIDLLREIAYDFFNEIFPK